MRTPAQAQYAAEFPKCQLYPVIRDWDGVPWMRHRSLFNVQVHHIFSMGSRPDLWSNMISVCFPLHPNWCHANLSACRVAAIWVKTQHDDIRFDWDELRQASGKQFPGWLETDLAKSDIPQAESLRFDLIERFC